MVCHYTFQAGFIIGLLALIVSASLFVFAYRRGAAMERFSAGFAGDFRCCSASLGDWTLPACVGLVIKLLFSSI